MLASFLVCYSCRPIEYDSVANTKHNPLVPSASPQYSFFSSLSLFGQDRIEHVSARSHG